MRIFDFTAADLEANRAGKITASQSQYLLKEVALSKPLLSLSIYFILVIIIFQNAGSMLFFIIPVEFILCMVVIVVALHNKQTVASDIQSGIADRISGTINRKSRRNGGDIIVADTTLKISMNENKELKKYWDVLPPQTQFRVYYLPRSKKLISIEAI
jgi:hypothetical protein